MASAHDKPAITSLTTCDSTCGRSSSNSRTETTISGSGSDIDPVQVEAELSAGARENGQAVRKLVVRDNDAYSEICPGGLAR
jgi:hypothetical protein